MTDALERLDAAVAETTRAALGPVTVARLGRPTRRDWSLHLDYVAEGASSSTALLVKVPLWQEAPTLEAAVAAGPQPDTAREHSALVAIHRAVTASGDPGLVAVEPIGMTTGVNAIVMVRLRAQTLEERLGRGRGRGDTGSLFNRLGRAMAMLHGALGPPRAGRFEAGDAGARLERVAAEAGRGPETLLPDLAAALAEATGAASAHGTLHGDLTQVNVLVTVDERVGIIDPNEAAGDVHLDPAHLLTDLTAGRRQILTLGLGRPHRVVSGWADQLLRGHGGIDPVLLRLHWAVALTERWADLTRRGGPTKGIAGTLGRRLIAPRVRSLLAAQQGAS